MKRLCLLLTLALIFVVPLHAQDTGSQSDQIALQRIQQARITGAIELDLSNLSLTQLPAEIWQLANLQHLNLGRNRLTELPSEIGQLRMLRQMIVDRNRLRTLPEEIGHLEFLQRLALEGNQITVLPPEIGQLRNLIELDLSDNDLSMLPPEIADLTGLCVLDLKRNNIKQLPVAMRVFAWPDAPAYCPYYYDYDGLLVEGNPLVFPPRHVAEQGTYAMLDYLQAAYERQQAEQMRWLLAAFGGVGMVALFLSGFRRKQHGGRKRKRSEV